MVVLVELVHDLAHVKRGERDHRDDDKGKHRHRLRKQPHRGRESERERGREHDERDRLVVDPEELLRVVLVCVRARALLGADRFAVLGTLLVAGLARLAGLALNRGGWLGVSFALRALDADADNERRRRGHEQRDQDNAQTHQRSLLGELGRRTTRTAASATTTATARPSPLPIAAPTAAPSAACAAMQHSAITRPAAPNIALERELLGSLVLTRAHLPRALAPGRRRALPHPRVR